MDNKRRALGRGLEELFKDETIDVSNFEKQVIENTNKNEIVFLPVNELSPNPYQPRKEFNEEKLQELASSIIEHGVLQPIIVKKSSIKGYEIIAGERRVKASRLAGKETIPAIIKDFNDEEMMEIALLENIQRESLNAIEEAEAYKYLLEKLNITQEVLAKKVGKSRSHITNTLGILTLPEEVKTMVIDGQLSMSHARTLSKMEDKSKILDYAKQITEEKINVRKVEEQRRKTISPTIEEYTRLEDFISDKLGTRVKINNNKVTINFVNEKDLNRILEILNISYDE